MFDALTEDAKEDKKEEEDKPEIKELERVMLLNSAYNLYDDQTEKTCLDYYFSMIYLLTNVAQVCPVPLKVLRTIATPYHLRLLFELLLVVSPKSKLKLIRIIKNLHAVQLPATVFQSALKEPLLKESEEPLLFTKGIQDPCSSFLYQYAA